MPVMLQLPGMPALSTTLTTHDVYTREKLRARMRNLRTRKSFREFKSLRHRRRWRRQEAMRMKREHTEMLRHPARRIEIITFGEWRHTATFSELRMSQEKPVP